MSLRIGVLPHADLPHIVPCFRLCRAISAIGHEAFALGSDVHVLGRSHGEAWGGLLDAFGLRGRALVHASRELSFFDWLVRQLDELRLDALVVDAVWQGLAWGCRDGFDCDVVVHHAGLPDFRTQDMPSWYFVHPGHPGERQAIARRSNEQRERSGQGIRGLLSSVKALSPAGRRAKDAFAFGCGEFADLPAVRAMSLPPDAEFPDERGRVACLGTLLPRPGEVDWQPLPAGLADAGRGLIACVFGTTGLRSRAEYGWLLDVAARLAHRFPDCQVVAVSPEQVPRGAAGASLPANLSVHAWIPLWELLSLRRAAKVLVTTPGVGALREAIASGTPIVAVPRSLDQFGAAARVEYFGIGQALVERELPAVDDVVERVAHVLGDAGIHERSAGLCRQVADFDATRPLERFFAGIGRR